MIDEQSQRVDTTTHWTAQPSGLASPYVIVCDITVIVLYIRLKCQLSGDVLNDSWSLLNSIKSNPECFVLLIQTPYPLHMFVLCHIMKICLSLYMSHYGQKHSYATMQ